MATYLPVVLFSLKSALATASGGKTVLVPTPYAIKMALLDAAIRSRGVDAGRRIFPIIRDLRVALDPPVRLVVLNSFGKVRRPLEMKDASKAEQKVRAARERGAYPFQPTIAYREYVQFGGAFRLALAAAQPEEGDPAELARLLGLVNYLGKRGGFIQLAGPPAVPATLDNRFVDLTAAQANGFAADGTMQALDDCGPRLTFERANIYSAERITMGQDRVLRHVPLPLRLERSSRGYSLYVRVD
jgi:hypothetical protein